MVLGAAVILYAAYVIVRYGVVDGLLKALRTMMIRRDGLSAVGTAVASRPREIRYSERMGPGVLIPRVAVRQERLISFTTADGRAVEFWADLDGPDAPKPRDGGYEIRYLAGDPDVHRFAEPRVVSAWFWGLFGLVLGGLALWFGIWILNHQS